MPSPSANRHRTGPRRHPSRSSPGTLERTPHRPRSPREHLRMRAQSPRQPARHRRAGQPGEGVSAAVEGQRERRHSTTVNRYRHRIGVDLRGGGDLREQLPLQRMRREAVALRLVAPLAADGEKACVLPGAGVLERGRVGAGLEIGLGRGCGGEQACAPRRAAPDDARATHTRSRSPGRRGRAAPERAAAPESASRRSAESVTPRGSPASATICPSRTATACTVCSASTTSPRVTSTWIGSAIAGTLRGHARATGSRGVGARARPARLAVAGRARRALAHRHR